MASLIRFLEAARNVWRTVVLVVGCIAVVNFYQYENDQPSIFTGDDFGSVIESVRTQTNFSFMTGAFERLERIVGFAPRNPVSTATRAAAGDAGPEPASSDRSLSTGSGKDARGPAITVASASTPNRRGQAEGPLRVSADTAVSDGRARSSDDAGQDAATLDPRVGVAFRRFASQFCRATRSIEMYYSDRINGPNGNSATRVGSGVRFPSIDRLTSGRDRSLAEKELEVRLRCDYELTYGTGEHTDPNRPAFEQWRQATLERQYGGMWTRIDLSHVPTPDDPMSHGEWYVYTARSQE